jgi:hypothetical protein
MVPAPGGAETVTGEVTGVEDLVPVDGGVTIEIDLDSGGKDRLLFPSLFTYPPPDEATVELYDLVRRVETGDRVRARGERTTEGIRIRELAILSGRSR